MTKDIEVYGHKIKMRTWTYGMKQRALKKATTWVRDAQGLQPDVDPWMLNDEMLVQCLVEWDFKDGKGKPLPITISNIHELEPPEMVEEMIAFCQLINGVSGAERKKS